MRELPTINLTDSQKQVLAKIIAAPSPRVASSEIMGNQNIVSAKEELVKLGVVEVRGEEIALTPSGQQLAIDNNIADQAGELTQDGQQLAYDNNQEQPQQPVGGMDQQLNMSYTPRREPLELLRELLYPKN